MKKNIIIIICIVIIFVVFGLLIINSKNDRKTNNDIVIVDFNTGDKKSIKEIVETIENKKIDEQNNNFELISISEENIVTIDNNTITALKKGSTIMEFKYNKTMYKILIKVDIQAEDGVVDS